MGRGEGETSVRTQRAPHPEAQELFCPVSGHLLGVGSVPEDGVAVGHHFGPGLLAEHAHQQHQADEEDHVHVQHHYGQTSYSSFSVGRVRRVRARQAGQAMRVSRTRPCVPAEQTKERGAEGTVPPQRDSSRDTCSG